ncbi:MAG: NAD(P)-dependent oxidoreductase [Prevotella sp.]|nr:NAD(P)-dependent oxidoreductase [Prevotella sp.]
MKILISGGSGLLGHYLRKEFSEDSIVELPGSSSLDLSETLSIEKITTYDNTPDIPFDLVVHAAGTSEQEHARRVNVDGTRHLLKALSRLEKRPKALCFVSCASVYSPDAGSLISEKTPTNPSEAVGRSKLEAEKECKLWAEAANVPLTILRPAMMFGTGVEGFARQMFRDVIEGRYLHVRGLEGRISIVCALDVAHAISLTIGLPGVFNVADESNPRWVDLAEAMSANAGARKRMVTLPQKWADVAWRYGRFIPAVKCSLSPCVRELRSSTCTLDSSLLRNLCSWTPFNTLEVLSRTADKYPYETE